MVHQENQRAVRAVHEPGHALRQRALRVIQFREVDALRETLQAHASRNELIQIDFVLVRAVQQPEQGGDVGSVEFQRIQVCTYILIVEMHHKLGDGDSAGTVCVKLFEDLGDLIHVHLLVGQHVLGNELLVIRSAVNSVLAENACKNVQDRELSEGDVCHEQHHRERVYCCEWLQSLVPADAVGDRFEQGEHAQGHRGPIQHERPVRLRAVHTMHVHSLREDDGEYVDDEQQE
mmetsp:Transcript_22110/g.63331  ORF Transcript_22110/g.63331 Transcript_22110/m.63331 type:complete len:233 (-) Transcript_22110:1160-1858(-)